MNLLMADQKRIQTISFLVLLAAVMIFVILLLTPFVNILALAVILAILFHPVYNWILGKIGYPSWASLITVVIMLLVIFLPLWLFGQLLWNEVSQAIAQLRDGQLVISRDQIVASVPVQIQDAIANFSRDLNSIADRFTSQAFSSVTSLLSNVANFVIGFFITFFIIFYLLRDGYKIANVAMDISPISSSQEHKLLERIKSAVNGVVKGSFLIALVQGAVATIGFFVFGVPQPFLWGVFTVLAALVPNIGTSISLVPAIIYLLVTGHGPQAIGLAIWAALAVGTIDNFLGPKLIGNSLRLHPVLVLLAVIGGIKFFGILGFLIGPILMAVFVELIDMYRTDFRDYLRG
jgi:predicted PurR-regulated permease PerM